MTGFAQEGKRDALIRNRTASHTHFCCIVPMFCGFARCVALVLTLFQYNPSAWLVSAPNLLISVCCCPLQALLAFFETSLPLFGPYLASRLLHAFELAYYY